MIDDNENEAENKKIDHTDTTYIDLGLDMDTDKLNRKFVSV